MECSKPLNFTDVIHLTHSEIKLTEFLRNHGLLFSFDGPCDHCADGLLVLRVDNSTRDRFTWRCSYWKCSHKVSFRKHSFFTKSQLPLSTIIEIIYYWTYRYPQEIVIHETRLNHHTVIDFYKFLWEVCSVILQEQSEQIGGPGKVVEIDEINFRKRVNRSNGVEGVWCFGGIERDSHPPKCFFVRVPDCSASTLIPIITQWILFETTIASNCWKAYSAIQAEGYIRHTLNHKLHFVSEKSTHTSSSERRWHAVKSSLPRHGVQKKLFSSYFAEYCIRRKHLDTASDKFVAVLDLVSQVYNPYKSEIRIPAHLEELVPQQQDTALAATETAASTCLHSSSPPALQIVTSSESDDNESDIKLFVWLQ